MYACMPQKLLLRNLTPFSKSWWLKGATTSRSGTSAWGPAFHLRMTAAGATQSLANHRESVCFHLCHDGCLTEPQIPALRLSPTKACVALSLPAVCRELGSNTRSDRNSLFHLPLQDPPFCTDDCIKTMSAARTTAAPRALERRLLSDVAEIQQDPYSNVYMHFDDANIRKACIILTPEGDAPLRLTVDFRDNSLYVPHTSRSRAGSSIQTCSTTTSVRSC
jgi:hypothetical protein